MNRRNQQEQAERAEESQKSISQRLCFVFSAPSAASCSTAFASNVLQSHETSNVIDHLVVSAMYKQIDVGTLFQSGLAYRYDADNWVRGYIGKKDFTDPEIEDLYAAGLELSLLTDEFIPRYFNGTRTQENSQISNQISRTFLPRDSKTFLQLRVELDYELDGLRVLLNDWNALIQGVLTW